MKIKADDLFYSEFDKCVDYALLEFGRKTAKKWIDSLIGIQVSQRILNPVGHLAGCLFGVVFYKDSSTFFQSISPLPVSSSSTARAMTLRLSALNGSVSLSSFTRRGIALSRGTTMAFTSWASLTLKFARHYTA